jgi:hypothetical protein
MSGNRKVRPPSPAMAVALVALFVALSGTAFAVGGGAIVPLAKRALTADKAKLADKATRAANADNSAHAVIADSAKQLGDAATAALVRTAVSQASQAPGPASSAAGLITIKTVQWSLGPNGTGDFAARCDSGQKAIAGGWDDAAGWAHPWDTRPTPDGAGWSVFVSVAPTAPGQQTGNVYAICVK